MIKMPSSLLATLFVLLTPFALWAGGIKGKITTTSGDPLAYVTIYVKELSTGTTSNVEGNYQYRLIPGNYTINFQSIGYQTEERQVTIADDFVELNIVLKEQIYELDRVEVTSGGRDPAYTIMRKASAKAAFHRNQLDSYAAQVYTKGSGRLLKAPFFLRKMLAKEGIDSSFAFTSESVSEVSYERPNVYKEKVISMRSSGDDNDTDPGAYVNASFYDPEVVESVSPLHPRAFAYYHFEYQGFFVDQGYEINKIKVTPRSRGDKVFEGTINIVDGEWAIHSLDLLTYQLGMGVQVEQMYARIEDKVWLPISHQFEVVGQLFGVKFEAKYLASVSDYDIVLNPDLDFELEVVDEEIEKELAQQITQITKNQSDELTQRLETGKPLTRKELRQLIKEYEKEEQQQQEEPQVEIISSYEIDSNATRRDSLYWVAIRPVPLTTLESRGYRVLDSMALAEKSDTTESGKQKSDNGKSGFFGKILFGGRFPLGDDVDLYIKPGLSTIQYNTVDGYNFRTGLGLRQKFGEGQKWHLEGVARYGFSRKDWNYRFETGLDFGKPSSTTITVSPSGSEVTHQEPFVSRIKLSGGRYPFQFNEEQPIAPILNTFWSLLLERNYMKLLEKDFVKLEYEQSLGRKWKLETGLEWSSRRQLANTTDHVFFDADSRAYTPNNPLNNGSFIDMPAHEAIVGSVQVFGYPFQKYRIRNGKKKAIRNSSPRLDLLWKQGGYQENDFIQSRAFTLLEMGIRHRFRVGFRGDLELDARLGGFLTGKDILQFPDFQHFMGNRILFTTSEAVGSFRLLDYYQHSTNDWYAELHGHYEFRKFLLSQIMEIRLLGIKENIFASYLYTPDAQHYTELGYGINNIARLFRLELVTAFQDGKYQDFGVRIGIAVGLDDIFE